MAEVYPEVDGVLPWGYFGPRPFRVRSAENGSLSPGPRPQAPAEASRRSGAVLPIEVDRPGAAHGRSHPRRQRRLDNRRSVGHDGKKTSAKSAICPFCDHVHSTALHRRLSAEGLREDVFCSQPTWIRYVGKCFREAQAEEARAADTGNAELLPMEPPFAPDLPAVPHEAIPVGNSSVIQPSVYGATSYGDLCNDRQTLGFVRLARVISELGGELTRRARAQREIRRRPYRLRRSVLRPEIQATPLGGPTLNPQLRPTEQPRRCSDIFTNEASISFSYDYFEAGSGEGPGTWDSLADDTVAVLRNQAGRSPGKPADISRGSAVALP